MDQLTEWEKGRDGNRRILAKANLHVDESSSLIGILEFKAADHLGEPAFVLDLRYGEHGAEATATEMKGRRRGQPQRFSWKYGDRRSLQAWANHVEGLARRYHVDPPAPGNDEVAEAIRSLIDARPGDSAAIIAEALDGRLDRDELRAFVAAMEDAAAAGPDGP